MSEIKQITKNNVTYKLGDIVQSTNASCNLWDNNSNEKHLGTIIQLFSIETTSCPINVEYIDNKGNTTNHCVSFDEIKLYKRNGKIKQPKPKDYHLILKESCMNFEKLCDNLKEAKNYIKSKKISSNFLIYKLDLIHKCIPSVKFEISKKVVKKKTTKRKTSKKN